MKKLEQFASNIHCKLSEIETQNLKGGDLPLIERTLEICYTSTSNGGPCGDTTEVGTYDGSFGGISGWSITYASACV